MAVLADETCPCEVVNAAGTHDVNNALRVSHAVETLRGFDSRGFHSVLGGNPRQSSVRVALVAIDAVPVRNLPSAALAALLRLEVELRVAGVAVNALPPR
jgi:hypothetical protein